MALAKATGSLLRKCGSPAYAQVVVDAQLYNRTEAKVASKFKRLICLGPFLKPWASVRRYSYQTAETLVLSSG